MSADKSVTHLIAELQHGDREAAQHLWENTSRNSFGLPPKSCVAAAAGPSTRKTCKQPLSRLSRRDKYEDCRQPDALFSTW
jgi:hypothetical protein